MRLNRPSFYTAVPSAGLSLLASDDSGSETSWCARDNGGDTLCFPAGFGNIYLGETLEAFVSACNNGSQQLTRLEVRAEIQTGTKRVPLLDGKTPNSVIPSFAPRQYTDYLVSHELKEAGVHIMICSGSYMDASGEEKKVRQYFKFQVQKPLAVTTKMHLLNNSILLENQIQNMTKVPLALHLIKLEPTPYYACEDLAADPATAPAAGLEEDATVFGADVVLRAGDVRQFVFKLVPRSGFLNPMDRSSSDLGRLEMAWKTSFGEPGRLHSLVNMQQWKLPPSQDVVIRPCRVPDTATVETPFTVELQVVNNKAEAIHLQLDVDLPLDGPILHCGAARDAEIGVLAAGAQHTVRTQLIALELGLWSISSAHVSVVEVDPHTKAGATRKYPLAHTIHVLVQGPDAVLEADTFQHLR